MKILVANLGSTSFKYRLFDMSGEVQGQGSRQIARGSVERIGSTSCPCRLEIDGEVTEMQLDVPHHGAAVRACVTQLTDSDSGCLSGPEDLAAIGFKAVHGGRLQGVFRINEEVLSAMEEVSSVAPAHNPPYLAAMRQLASTVPDIPLVAAFETDFHRTIPEPRKRYALPKQWSEDLPIRKWGFHGASHRYISMRVGELLQRSDARIISCHLGGSSSLCAIANGQSVATSMGMSPQTGVPQNNRVGDLDPFCLPMLMRYSGKDLQELLLYLSTQAGLLGLSGGTSGDLRDIEQAADSGNPDARLALDVYVEEIRRYLGSMLVALGGCDALVFTGGIGENSSTIRRSVCRGLEDLGFFISEEANSIVRSQESRIDAGRGPLQIWVVPTNEELIVARQTFSLLTSEQGATG
jgi:acetate kinase